MKRIVLRKHSDGEFAWTATATGDDGIAHSAAGHTQAEAFYELAVEE